VKYTFYVLTKYHVTPVYN